MEFENDPAKAPQNLKKHRVSFEEAASAFGDPMAYTFADPDHSIGEERWLMTIAYGSFADHHLHAPAWKISHHQCPASDAT